MKKSMLVIILPIFLYLIGCSSRLYLEGENSGLIIVDYKYLKTAVIEADGCPIKIIEYKSSHQKDEKKWKNWLKVINESKSVIVRYDCEFILYDVYGIKVMEIHGFSDNELKPHKSDSGGWSEYLFHGQAYKSTASITKIAFEDGSIWLR